LTALPQLFVQDAYTPANYGTHAQTNQVIARLIVPRIPRYSLLPFVQLIRPSFSVVTVPEGKGGATRTEFGDMGLFDLAVIPWPGEGSGLLMGVGPVFVFPTATDKTAGQGPGKLVPRSERSTKASPESCSAGSSRTPSPSRIRPATAGPEHAIGSTDLAEASLAWIVRKIRGRHVDDRRARRLGTTLPLSLGLGYVIPREGSPPINVFVSGQWMAYRQNAPVAPQTTVRFGMTIAFPEWTRWKGF